MKDTVSLGLAKRLRDAEWPQDNFNFCWAVTDKGNVILQDYLQTQMKAEVPNADFIAAPTIDELLEALPEGVDLHKERTSETSGHYSAGLDPETYDDQKFSPDWYYSPNPADALALLWLSLREKKLI